MLYVYILCFFLSNKIAAFCLYYTQPLCKAVNDVEQQKLDETQQDNNTNRRKKEIIAKIDFRVKSQKNEEKSKLCTILVFAHSACAHTI